MATAFSEFEQNEHDYDLFFADEHGRIAHISHVGYRLLPPTIAQSKENQELLRSYFLNLPVRGGYTVPDSLTNHLSRKGVSDTDGYIAPSRFMSIRGLYAFDSYTWDYKQRPYFIVTRPELPIELRELRADVQSILTQQVIKSIDFSKDELILEKSVSTV